MHFDLRLPCPECPFREAVTPYLTAARAVELVEALHEGQTFTCHKHIHGDRSRDAYRPGVDDQMCAGAMALVEREGFPHQMLQIAERLGLRDPKQLLPEALQMVYPTGAAMIEAYRTGDRF